jgi:hypothetical protein
MLVPLQDWELEGMREAADESLLTSTADLQRRNPTSTPSGGQVDGYALLSTIACRLEENPIRNEEKELGAGQKAESWWTVHLSWNVDVQVSDRFIIDGEVYQVTETEGKRSQSLIQNVKCRKVRV